MSETMSRTEIERIAARSPGWEKDWGKMYGLIGMELDKICDRDSAPEWPSDDACEEFKAWILDTYYTKKAKVGRLLANYDFRLGDPVKSVTASQFVFNRAKTFLSRKRPRLISLQAPLAGGDDDSLLLGDTVEAKEGGAQHFCSEELTEMHVNFCGRLDTALRGLVVNYDKVDATAEHAGAQLHPRCDWHDHNMLKIRTRLLKIVKPAPPRDVEATLEDNHQRRRNCLREEVDKMHQGIACVGYGTKTMDALIRTLNTLTYEFLFRPLDGNALRQLFPGLTAANAAQKRKRYREKLPELLAGNSALDAFLSPKDDDNEDS